MLGYAQPISDVDAAVLQAHGWDLVRRPTGGRAILHTDELTYSITGRQDDPRLAGSVIESYQRLSQALLRALTLLGIAATVEAHPLTPAGSDPKGPVCFEVPSTYEITYDHRKVIGSAQARRKGMVLQHGSFPLHGDLGRITQALHFTDEESANGRRNASTPGRQQRRRSWGTHPPGSRPRLPVQAFQETLEDLHLAPGELNDFEKDTAERLVREKYNHPEWTGKV